MTDDLALDPETWADRHGDFLYRVALLRVREPDAAADLVQETFLAALRTRESFSGRSSVRTWLVAILKHKHLDRLRKVGRRLEVLETDQVEQTIDGLFDDRRHWKSKPGDWGAEPGKALEQREFRSVLDGCLAGLPRKLAEAFALIELDSVGRDAICRDLEITPMNLSARLHRARLLLRDCLEKRWFRAEPQPNRPVRGNRVEGRA